MILTPTCQPLSAVLDSPPSLCGGIVLKAADVWDFLHGGEAFWGEAFRELFHQAYEYAWYPYASDQVFSDEFDCRNIVYAIFRDEAPLAFCIVTEGPQETPHLRIIFTDSDYRLQGLATLLLELVQQKTGIEMASLKYEGSSEEGRGLMRKFSGKRHL